MTHRRSRSPLRQRHRNQHGQLMGGKGQTTRRRLLDATRELLERRGLRALRVSEISALAGISASTFYVYFRDAEDAALTLAREASESERPAIETLEQEWPHSETLDLARQFVDEFLAYWDEHTTVLRVRNMASDEGSKSFQRVRNATLEPMLTALGDKIRAAQRAGRLSADIHPFSAAAAMVASLERLAAFYPAIEAQGVTRKRLVETMAHLLALLLGEGDEASET